MDSTTYIAAHKSIINLVSPFHTLPMYARAVCNGCAYSFFLCWAYNFYYTIFLAIPQIFLDFFALSFLLYTYPLRMDYAVFQQTDIKKADHISMICCFPVLTVQYLRLCQDGLPSLDDSLHLFHILIYGNCYLFNSKTILMHIETKLCPYVISDTLT